MGSAHSTAEEGTARGVAAAGSPMCISNYATRTLSRIARVGQRASQWFQLYMSKDDGYNRFMLDRALDADMKAIVLTADATVGGNREADLRNHFSSRCRWPFRPNTGAGKGESISQIYARGLQRLSAREIERIACYSRLPLVVKGIRSPADAALALGAGAAAVWVSNHGGRQLDGGPASFAVLRSAAEAIGGRVPVIFDSGVRRAQHVFKAPAEGADVVALNRAAIYGLALGGWKGVRSVFDHFLAELQTLMHSQARATWPPSAPLVC